MIELEKVQNGLTITLTDAEELEDLLDRDDRPSMFDLLEISRYIGNGWDDATDNLAGALTSSPIIVENGETDEESGMYVDAENVYWFPNYMLEDELETLANEGSVFFTKAN